MNKTPYCVLITLITLTIFSCKKSSTNTTASCALSQASIMGTFRYDSVKYKSSASAPAVNAHDLVDSCSADDIITLAANNAGTYTDAGVKCSPPGDGAFTWSLSGTTLTLSGQSSHISNFNCSRFTVAQADFLQPGDTLLITFKRQ